MIARQESVKLLLIRLHRQITKLQANSSPKNIHRFRTCSRRVETVLDRLDVKPRGSNKKLVKSLHHLRKKAGYARDLEVQIALLRSLKMPEGARHKSQLLQTLLEERARCEQRLQKAYNRQSLKEMRQRLKRATTKFDIADGALRAELQDYLTKLAGLTEALSPDVLDEYRALGKRLRYLAELADPTSSGLIAPLKLMQNAIGDWRDWLKLLQRAEKLFSRASGSPLVSALRNLTRVKFRNAAASVTETRSVLFPKKTSAAAELTRKPASATPTPAITAA